MKTVYDKFVKPGFVNELSNYHSRVNQELAKIGESPVPVDAVHPKWAACLSPREAAFALANVS